MSKIKQIKKLLFNLLYLHFILQILDTITTLRFLSYGGIEGNFIIKFIILNFGLNFFILFKILFSLIIIFSLLMIYEYVKEIKTKINILSMLYGLNLFYFVIILLNFLYEIKLRTFGGI